MHSFLVMLLAGLAASAGARVDQEPPPEPPETAVEEHVTVIATTRSGRRIEDEPLRVETLEREEIEEKMLMTPGDIVMLLNEMGGMRVQSTSPSLGAASVRIQGMRGRYTRVLADGLPLFGEVRGLGLLQIPPMDLGQVEVIKGVASALYGPGAMGGVINVLSRRPTAEPARELLFNRSTRGATDTVAYVSTAARTGWSGSLLVSGHWQSGEDVDDDGWTDLAEYERGVIRPRVFWDNGRGGTLFATVGAGVENRNGGTIDGAVLPATGETYFEALETRRADTGLVGQFLIKERVVVSARFAAARQSHDHTFGEVLERDTHGTVFGEIAARWAEGRHTWIVGAAVDRDVYDAHDVPRFDHAFTVPGVFVQHDIDFTPAVSLSSSGRLDRHSEYGTFFSPRVSMLARNARWSARASVGTGFVGPSAITEETEAAGLTRLTVAAPLGAERGVGGSFDLSHTRGAISYTATLFASRISHPIHTARSPGYAVANLDEALTTVGTEALIRFQKAPFVVTGSYMYARARETVDRIREDVALTPRHSAGVVGMWEVEDRGRVGIEWYFTGRQRLDENPYRSVSRPYVVVGLLAERKLGRFRLFVNGENLTGVRQTRFDPMLLSERAADGRWTVDAWAPVEGRTVNGGLRLEF